MTLQQRLDCPHSYATEDNTSLLCDIGNTICDGTLYQDCLMDRSFDEQIEYLKHRKELLIDDLVSACEEINRQIKEVKTGEWKRKLEESENNDTTKS